MVTSKPRRCSCRAAVSPGAPHPMTAERVGAPQPVSPNPASASPPVFSSVRLSMNAAILAQVPCPERVEGLPPQSEDGTKMRAGPVAAERGDHPQPAVDAARRDAAEI